MIVKVLHQNFRSKARRRFNIIRFSEGRRGARLYQFLQLSGPASSRFPHRRQADLIRLASPFFETSIKQTLLNHHQAIEKRDDRAYGVIQG